MADRFPISASLLAAADLNKSCGNPPSSPGNAVHRLLRSIWKDANPMREDVEQLKQRISLLEYLQRRNWTPWRVGLRQELVGLCPLHAENRPSFYVNARTNLFYCHGCQRGGDLIRFVELSEHLSFRETIAIVALPSGHDPNSYMVAGATAADFRACLQQAYRL